MLEAQSSLGSISSFMHDAQAYMKGQLQCTTVQEAFLWERYHRTDDHLCLLHYNLANWDGWCPPPPTPNRLAEAKSSVVKALAEDFDTPQAVSAVMNLVHHANRQLQPVSKVTGAEAHCVVALVTVRHCVFFSQD